MAEVIVGTHVSQLAGLGIGMNRGKTIVVDMIRSAFLVQQDVPIRPALGAVVEIVDHGNSVCFTPLPFLDAGRVKRRVATFGEQ